jgi:hypothetical protein
MFRRILRFKRTVNIFAWFFRVLLWLLADRVYDHNSDHRFLLHVFHGKEKLWLSATLTVIAFIFFWSLFVRLLNLPFPDGLVQTWLGMT